MKFIDLKHKLFYEQKLKEIGKSDVYRRALIYTLAICPVTREHFNDIFDLKNGEININSINAPYQTGSSEKVTRLAFSLWNRCNYDSEEDIENDKVSIYYNPSEIFCCSYAPFFWQAIQLRYPEFIATDETLHNTLIDVVKLIKKKYSGIIDVLLQNDKLTLAYMYNDLDSRKCFQIIEIQELNDKLKLEFVPEHTKKIISLHELEDIFEIIRKKLEEKQNGI